MSAMPIEIGIVSSCRCLAEMPAEPKGKAEFRSMLKQCSHDDAMNQASFLLPPVLTQYSMPELSFRGGLWGSRAWRG